MNSKGSKWVAPASIFALALSLLCTPGAHAEDKAVDLNYIKEHYPAAYEQIFKEGMEAAKKVQAQTQAQPQTKTLAQEKPADAKTPPAVADASSKKNDLGDWWNKSSLSYDPLPSEWLNRGEFKYSFMGYTGNASSHANLIYARWDTRKGRYTNSLAFTLDNSNTDINSMNYHYKKDQRMLEDTLKYDITENFYGDVGFIWEKNSALLVDRRYAVYGGLGYRLLTLDDHKLSALLAYGYLNERYASDIQSWLGFMNRDFDTLYLNQTYDWKINEYITFNEKLMWIHSFNKVDRLRLDASGNLFNDGMHKRNLMTVDVSLNAMITDNISFFGAYQVKYDNIPWAWLKKRDTMLSTGLKMTFQ